MSTVHASLRRQSESHPGDVALIAARRRPLTHGALFAFVERAAHEFLSAGVGPGSRVALVLPPGPESVTALLAVMTIAAAAPLSPQASEAEVAAAFDALRVGSVVVAAGTQAVARRVAAERGLRVIEIRPVPDGDAGAFGVEASGAASQEAVWSSAGDEALILRTSGTTSEMKTVALTHANIVTAAEGTIGALELGPLDRCLNLLPMFHLSGTVFGTLTPLFAGGSIVVPSSAFEARAFFALLGTYAPTWFSATPTVFAAILARDPFEGETLRRTSLRFIRSSAAALPPQVLTALEKTFGVPVLEAYSLTEAPGVTSNVPGARLPGSVGRTLGGEIAIVGPGGSRLAASSPGSIHVRGAHVMRGYEGAESGIGADGWFDTGDVGYLDADGNLYITGRNKDMINRGGEVIAPKEIEDALLDLPAVRDIAAFAVPDERLGENVAVAIVLQPDQLLDASAVRDFVAARLSPSKVPGPVLFLGELPKGGTGKVLRRELTRIAAGQSYGTGTVPGGGPASPVEELVAELWREYFGVEAVARDANFFDYGGDSLLAARFAGRINSMLAIALPIHRVLLAPTVAGIAAEIEERIVDDEHAA